MHAHALSNGRACRHSLGRRAAAAPLLQRARCVDARASASAVERPPVAAADAYQKLKGVEVSRLQAGGASPKAKEPMPKQPCGAPWPPLRRLKTSPPATPHLRSSAATMAPAPTSPACGAPESAPWSCGRALSAAPSAGERPARCVSRARAAAHAAWLQQQPAAARLMRAPVCGLHHPSQPLHARVPASGSWPCSCGATSSRRWTSRCERRARAYSAAALRALHSDSGARAAPALQRS